MMMDTPAHPQHMNVVNYFVCIMSGCGKHPMLVWDLTQCTMTQLLTYVQLGFLAISENLDQGVWL
jgi:hypothetical protein